MMKRRAKEKRKVYFVFAFCFDKEFLGKEKRK